MSGTRSLAECARLGKRLDDVFVFDVHQHVGAWHPFHIPAPGIDDAVAIMDRLGIDAAVTSGLPAVLGTDTRGGNDAVIDAAARYPGRIFGYVAVNPNDPADAAEEVKRCAAAGLTGIKVHNIHAQSYDHEKYRAAYEIAETRGWPVLTHTWGGEELAEIDKLAEEYPNVRWILAHAGTTNVPGYVNLARRRDNVYLDTCASACYFNLVEKLVTGAGVEKVLFGTDMTFLSGAQQIGKILFARISDGDKERVLGENARRVFNLPE